MSKRHEEDQIYWKAQLYWEGHIDALWKALRLLKIKPTPPHFENYLGGKIIIANPKIDQDETK